MNTDMEDPADIGDYLNLRGITSRENLNIYLVLIVSARPSTYLDCLLRTTNEEYLACLAENDKVALILNDAISEARSSWDSKQLVQILNTLLKIPFPISRLVKYELGRLVKKVLLEANNKKDQLVLPVARALKEKWKKQEESTKRSPANTVPSKTTPNVIKKPQIRLAIDKDPPLKPSTSKPKLRSNQELLAEILQGSSNSIMSNNTPHTNSTTSLFFQNRQHVTLRSPQTQSASPSYQLTQAAPQSSAHPAQPTSQSTSHNRGYPTQFTSQNADYPTQSTSQNSSYPTQSTSQNYSTQIAPKRPNSDLAPVIPPQKKRVRFATELVSVREYTPDYEEWGTMNSTVEPPARLLPWYTPWPLAFDPELENAMIKRPLVTEDTRIHDARERMTLSVVYLGNQFIPDSPAEPDEQPDENLITPSIPLYDTEEPITESDPPPRPSIDDIDRLIRENPTVMETLKSLKRLHSDKNLR